MFTAADIQARLRQRPFTPIRFVTTTGQIYDIPHPDLVMVGRRFVVVGTPSVEDPSQAEQVNRVTMIHLTEIQDLPGTASPHNGPPG
jgi:hypothetical protein